MEAEAREIITAAVMSGSSSGSAESLQSFVEQLYEGELPENASDELIAQRRAEAKKESW